MKRLIALLAIFTLSLPAIAKVVVTITPGKVGDISADSVVMGRQGDGMRVEIGLDLSSLELESTKAVLLTPMIIGDSMRVELPSVGIYGKKSYKYYGNAGLLSGAGEIVLQEDARGDRVAYGHSVQWEEWMKDCDLLLIRRSYDSRGQRLSEGSVVLATSEEQLYKPVFKYVRPKGEGVKHRSIGGSVFITYPNDKVSIKTGLGHNASELAKIETDVKSVSGDPDITITSVSFDCHTSPDGTYESNALLTAARAEALRDYVVENFRVKNSITSVGSEPENWADLREYVDGSILVFRTEILDVIDNDPSEPDRKEWIIKSRYPRDYQRLVRDCYPSLRRTDYKVDYVIMSYSDVDEMRHLASSAPEKLSLEEFWLAAQGLDPEGKAHAEIFEAAVRVFPDDPIANLNAANAAMAQGDLEQASTFLAKAGDSPQASYAREVYAALSGDPSALARLEGQ